jgi:hypothetical protein
MTIVTLKSLIQINILTLLEESPGAGVSSAAAR